jgi:hypothetical protein
VSTGTAAADTAEIALFLRSIARSELRLADPRIDPFPTDSSHSEFFTLADGENQLLAKVIRDDYLSASPRTVLHEYSVLALAHRAGLAPKPRYANLARRLLIQDFLTGDLLGEWSEGNIATCARLGMQLMRIDTGSAELCRSHVDYDEDIAAHTATLRALHLPDVRGGKLRSDLLRLAEPALAFCRGARQELNGLPLVLSHNDLSPENVIRSPRGPVLIDFETAALSRPDFLVGQLAVDAAIDDVLCGRPARPFDQLWSLVLDELTHDVSVRLCRARVVERLLQNAAYGLRQAARFEASADRGAYAAKKLAVAAFCHSALDRCVGSW